MIEVRGLSKRYGDLVALVDVSLQVAAGEMLVVLGASGAGKSTLLRCINRLVTPSDDRAGWFDLARCGGKP